MDSESGGLRVYAARGPSRGWPGARFWLALLLLAVLAGGAVAGFAFWSRATPRPVPPATASAPAPVTGTAAPAAAKDEWEISILRKQVEQLRQENTSLREQLANAEARAQRPAGTPAVANGGFEEAAGAGPSFWIADNYGAANLPKEPVALDREVKHGGAQALRLETAKGQPTHLRLKQLLPVEPRRKYLLRGWIKSQDVTPQQARHDGGAHLRVKAGQSVRYSKPVLDTNDWVEVLVEFATEDVHAVEIYAELGYYGNLACGTAWFDDLTLELNRGPDAETKRAF